MHKDPNKDSTLTLGYIEESKFRNTSETRKTLKWFNVDRNSTRFAWKKEMRNVFYDKKSFDDGKVNDAVFDSFYGGIHLPLTEWVPLMQSIMQNLEKQDKDYLECDFKTTYKCQYHTKCSFHKDDFKNLAFNFIDTRGYEVVPDDYLFDTTEISGNNLCII
jgi:hypothetical protein